MNPSDESRVDVLLLAPHRHFGEPKKKSDVINVTIAQSNWLISHGIAQLKPEMKPNKED